MEITNQTSKRLNDASILAILKQDLQAATDMRKELDNKIAKWKREYNGEAYGNEVDGKSKLVSRDIKKQSEWQHAPLLEPFVSTPDIIKARPRTYEDAKAARNIALLLNTQFCTQFNRYNFMSKALQILDQEGTCVVRLGWEYEEKEIEELEYFEVPNPQYEQASQIAAGLQASGNEEALQNLMAQMQNIPQTIQQSKIIKRVKPVKNRPTATLCRNEDIFIDPTCMDDMDNCQFVIYRYETDLSSLKLNGTYKNLDKIAMELSSTSTDDYKPVDTTNFEFSDKARKKLLVYEYWGNLDINGDDIAEPIMCAWIGDVVIKLEENPFPDKKPPFIITPFSPRPFSLYGESNAELLSDIQKIKTAIYRGFIDNITRSNNGQKGFKLGSLDAINKKRFLSGENFEFQGHLPTDIYEGRFNELPGSSFNLLTLMNQEAESLTGVSSFNAGITGNALGSTATAVRSAVDSASARRINIVRNASENLVKPLLRKWIAYNAAFLDEESQIRITNDEFVWIKRDDLYAEIDIELNISTSDDNQAKASELAFILQTATGDESGVRQMLMAEIMRLYRMPELAKMIEEYQPQPDPVAEQIRQLQVAMLQAQVANEQAKANENQADLGLKQAKTETELAKAKNLNSMADKNDLDYLQQYYGTKHKQELEKQAMNNTAKQNEALTKMIANASAGQYL